MTAWLLACVTARALEVLEPDEAASTEALAPAGRAVTGFGGAHGVGLSEQVVVGGDGGTAVTTVAARGVIRSVTIAAWLPFAAYRTADRRDTALGNLRLDALAALPGAGPVEHALGATLGFGLGGDAFTWATRADELWPGGGLDLVYELRVAEGPTTWLGRGALGVHGSRGWEPVPGTWARLAAAGAVDRALGDRAGVVAEAAVAWWDVAPVQLSALVRVDPLDGLRLRGGLALPVFTWFGWDPLGRPGGAREATVHLDLAAAF